MIKNIHTILSKLNKALREKAALKAVVTILACIVVFVVTYAMIIPAVTMEYKANKNEISIASANLRTSEGSGTIQYSSDLADFATGMSVTNSDGTALSTSNTVTVDTDYILTLSFAEKDLLQMQVDSATGTLTYQLPDSIKTVPTNDGKIYVNGNVLFGTYTIDSDGLITISPNKCDIHGNTTTDYFIDNYQNTEISISFAAQVAKDADGGAVSIDLGNNVSVTLDVKDGGNLKTTKTYVGADFTNKVLTYQITVTADKTDISDVVIYDKANESQRFSLSTMTILGPDGTDIKSQFTEITPTPKTAKSTTDTTNYPLAYEGFSSQNCSNLPSNDKEIAFFAYGDDPERATTEMYAYLGTVHAGETYTFNYTVPMSDYCLTSNESKYLTNQLTATGVNTDGDNVESNSSSNHSTNYTFLQKNGTPVSGTNKIKWTVKITNGGAAIGAKAYLDFLTSGSFDKTEPIAVKYRDMNDGNSEKTTTLSWTDASHLIDMSGIEGTDISAVVFLLPLGTETASEYTLTYYSTYPTDSVTGKFENMFADYSNYFFNGVEEIGATVVGTAVVDSVGVRATKNGYITDDGDYVHYDINVNVPAGANSLSKFYLYDYLKFPSSTYSNNRSVFGDVTWENVSIVATDSSGTVLQTFTPYTSGDAAGTYTIEVTGNNLPHYIYFNSATKSGSKWNIAESCTLTISYDVPLDCDLVSGTTPITDYTGEYLLQNGVTEQNIVYLYYGSNYLEVTSQVKLSTFKSGTIDSDGKASYEVKFDPRTSAGSYLPTTTASDGTMLNVSGFKFIDNYCDELSYVDGTLKIKVIDTNDSGYAVFTYNGDSSGFDGNHTISADAYDFILDTSATTNSMKNSSLTRLSEFLAGQIGYQDCTFTATYDLQVTDDAKGEVATTLTLNNSGHFEWTGGEANTAQNTLTYDTKLMSKDFVRNGDVLDYTILLNPGKLDLLEDNDTIKIKDRMSDNLSVYWDTIKVYYYDDDTDSWIEMNDTSGTYRCTKSYDPDTNSMTFEVPDSQYLKFVYTTLITETGTVSVNNTVSLVGYGDVVKASEASFSVAKSGGTASAGDLGFTLSKSNTEGEMLEGASFALYTEVSNPEGKDENPYSAPETVTYTFDDGTSQTLYYYKTYTTGTDGTVYIESQYFYDDHNYAVCEANAPEGYLTITDPIFFNLNPKYIEREREMQQISNMLSIVDDHEGTILPSTGGIGVYVYWAAGTALIITGLAVLIKKKKKFLREVVLNE